MADDLDLDDLEKRMSGALDALKKEFQGLRTGRASVNLLDTVQVEAYGSHMPINQVGSVSVPEPRMLTIQVWDKGMVKAVEKAIRTSDLGLNPMSDGQLIRIQLPDLTEERRTELSKVAARYAESGRVAVRNVRRDVMYQLKKMEKDGDLSEDDKRLYESDVQDLTDKYTGMIDELLSAKEKDIMQV